MTRDSVEAGAEFHWVRNFRLPWMERTPVIDAGKAARIVRKNKPDKMERLKVVPPGTSVQLPLRSQEDLTELAVLLKKGEPALLPHRDLGESLQDLAGRGWRFDIRQDYQDVEGGLYAAYNALTDPSHQLEGLKARHPELDVRLPLADEATARDLADFYRNPGARSPEAATLATLEGEGYRLVTEDGSATCAWSVWKDPSAVWIGRRGEKWMPAAALALSSADRVRPTLEQLAPLREFTGRADSAREAWQLLQRPVSGTIYEQRQALLLRLGKAEGSGAEAAATYKLLLDGLAPRQTLEEAVGRYEAMRTAMAGGGAAITPRLARETWTKLRPLGLDEAGMKTEAAAIGRWTANRAVGQRAAEVWEALREDCPDPTAMREALFKKLLEAEKGTDSQVTDALAGWRLAREIRQGAETVTETGNLVVKALGLAGGKQTAAAHLAVRVAREGPAGRAAAAVDTDVEQASRLFVTLNHLDRARPLWALLSQPVNGESLTSRVDAFLALQAAEKGDTATEDAERCYLAVRHSLLPGEDLAAAARAMATVLKLAGEPDDERTLAALFAWETLRGGSPDARTLERRQEVFAGWAKGVGFSLATMALIGLDRLRPDIPFGDRLDLLEQFLGPEKGSKDNLADSLANVERALREDGGPQQARQLLDILKKWGYRSTKAAQAAMARIGLRAGSDADWRADLATAAAHSQDLKSFGSILDSLDAMPAAERRDGAAVYARLMAAEQGHAGPSVTLARELGPRMGGFRSAGETMAKLIAACGGDRGRSAAKRLAQEWGDDAGRNAALVALFCVGAEDPVKVADGLAEDERQALVALVEGRRFRYPGFAENWKDFEAVRSARVAGETLKAEADRLVEVQQSLAAGKQKGDVRETHRWLRARLAEGKLGDHVGIDHAHKALTRALVAGRSLEDAKKALLEGAALKVVEEEGSVTVGGITLPKRQGE